MTHMKLEQNYKCKNVLNAPKIKTYWNVERGAVLKTKARHKALILVSSEKLKHLQVLLKLLTIEEEIMLK